MREIALSEFGLEPLADACVRKGWVQRTAQKWVQDGHLAAAVVGAGRSAKYLVRTADVDAFTPPPRGRPVKDKPAPAKEKAAPKAKGKGKGKK